MAQVMQIALDDNGQPFILVREQGKKQRVKGIEAHKSNIAAAKSIASTLRTSLGPRGMDKIIISPDGDVTVTNDGATILDKMEVKHECAKLLVELSKSQDDEIGDGTTGVVVLAGALLDEAYKLLERGLHPLRISDGFDRACEVALKALERVSESRDPEANDHQLLRAVAKTALGSKVVTDHQDLIAGIAIKAILAVADIPRKDVNFDLIKIEGKSGAPMSKSMIVDGIVLDKDLSHPQMNKITKDAKIAILTCPFEPPKPKTKHKLEIHSAEQYKKLQSAEGAFFSEMIEKVKASGANFVICQWGFDDEANHLLMANNIPAVRWVGGTEMELLAIATGGRIVPRFEDLTAEKLGSASSISEVTWGTQNDEMIFIEGVNAKSCTIVLRGTNSMIVEEAKRSTHDALCCLRNLIRDPRIVAGGGAAEISCAVAVEDFATSVPTVEQFAIQGFADALLSIPGALAENSGLNAIVTVADAKACQIERNDHTIGIDCKQLGTGNMLEQGVYESYAAKSNQISLATQVVKLILKIDDVIQPAELQDMM